MNRYSLLLMTVLLTAAPVRADEAADRLAAAARTVLEKTCARCHANGQTEGGFGFVLDATQLVERKRVVPGDSAKSRLFKTVQSESAVWSSTALLPREQAEEVALRATVPRWEGVDLIARHNIRSEAIDRRQVREGESEGRAGRPNHSRNRQRRRLS